MRLEFVLSNKGILFAMVNGYAFRKEKTFKRKTYWKCTECDRFNCRSRHTESDVVTAASQHNRVPDAAKIEVRKTMNIIKVQAKTSQDEKSVSPKSTDMSLKKLYKSNHHSLQNCVCPIISKLC